MSEANIRAALAASIAEVADIGKVYDYERFTADMSMFLEIFKVTIGGVAQIRGCEITRRSAQVVYDSNEEETVRHEYLLRCYMGLQDASATEKSFNALIEALRTQIRFDFTLGGSCELAGPVNVQLIEARMFGSVLCHYAELQLFAQELNTN